MSKLNYRSFAAGEIAEEVYGRIDLTRYQTGLKSCRNMITLPQGPARDRAGLKYVLETRDSTKRTTLIPFSYNNQQTYALEFGDQVIRFHQAGATLLETAKVITAVSQANPGVVTSAAHGFVNGDVVYLAAIGGMTALNGRFVKVAAAAANSFALTGLDGANINTSALPAYTAGGTAARVYVVASPYLEADLPALHYVQSADVLTLTHPNYAPRELRRLGATNWTLTVVDFTPVSSPGAGFVKAFTPTAVTMPQLYEYQVTKVSADGTIESEPTTVTSESPLPAISAITNANPAVLTSAAHGLLLDDPINIIAGDMPEITGRTLYVDTVPTANTFTLREEDGTVVDSSGYSVYTTGAKIDLHGAHNDLTLAGNHNRILSGTNLNQSIRFYKKAGGVFGFIGELQASPAAGVTILTLKDYNITPDTSRTPPTIDDEVLTGADNYPRAVTYFQQRRWFGGTNNARQSLYATRSGTENDLGLHTPTRDDDRLNVRLAARQANTIEHLVPLDDLIALTQDAEFKVFSAAGEAITPSTIDAKAQGYVGCNTVQPAATSTSVLYATQGSGTVRELKFSFDSNKYESNDRTLLAPHLFEGFDIVSMAYQRRPVQILWCVRSDGTLLGFTYQPEQDVAAWHRHDTDGAVESICCIAEGREDVLYASIRREIGGRTVRYVERMGSRLFATLADSFLVDAGLSYNGAPAMVFSNLHHLEGEAVSILADGAVVTGKVVAGGAITLDQAASKVHVGLSYTCDFETLPIVMETQGSGQGVKKNVSKAYVKVKASSAFKVGPSFDDPHAPLVPVKLRTNEALGSPPSIVSKTLEVLAMPKWTDDGGLCIRKDTPTPLTIISMAFEYAHGA